MRTGDLFKLSKSTPVFEKAVFLQRVLAGFYSCSKCQRMLIGSYPILNVVNRLLPPETEKPPAAGSTAENEAGASSTAGDLESGAEEIQKQALGSRSPEEGSNLLDPTGL